MSGRPSECYICSDDTPPLYRMCACDRLVHEACFTRLVQTVPSHRTHCPVCRSPNPGEVVRTIRHRIVVDIPTLLAADFNITLTGLFLMWTLSIDVSANNLVAPVQYFAALLFLVTLAWCMCLHLRILVTSRRLCGIAHRRLVEETTRVVLPEPCVVVV